MRADIEYLELRIQELEEENLQLKGELDERPTCEDKQMDEQYIDELVAEVVCLKKENRVLQAELSEAQQGLASMRDLCAAQGAVLRDLCAEIEYQQRLSAEVA